VAAAKKPKFLTIFPGHETANQNQIRPFFCSYGGGFL
jgi:hypothetical protein